MPTRKLIADIGGTNARFAVREGKRVLKPRSVAVRAYRSVGEAIAEYLGSLPRPVDAAVLAMAAPIIDGRADMTNSNWSVDADRLRREFGIPFELVNDFASVAAGVRHLAATDVVKIGRGKKVNGAPILAVGPGTGLGVSAAIPCSSGWHTVPSEGGHVGLAARTSYESKVVSLLAGKGERVSAETVLCGPGLVSLYGAICEIESRPRRLTSAAGITRAAVNGSSRMSARTLRVFCSLLGSTAGDLALTFGATGGVYIAGGIVPRIVDFVKKSDFRRRFEDKGPVSYWVESMPTYVILARYPAFAGLGI